MFYCTSYCNQGHRVSDGYPLGHECNILPPAALQAEINGDHERAIEILSAAKPMKVSRGVRCRHNWGPNFQWTRDGVKEPIVVCCENCGESK
jgi:hypothetical protein